MASDLEPYYPCKWKGPGTIRGAALVLNYKFPGRVNLERIGSEKDMERITGVLKDHGYDVRANIDLSYQDTEDTLKSFIEDEIHGKNDTDSTVVVIMSHGDAAHEFNGSLFLTFDEKPMASQPIVDKFQYVRGLEGKPKLFFFNFCRVGQPLHELSEERFKEVMEGYYRREAEFWLNEPAVRNAIPDQKTNRPYNDTLIVYSTIPRFPSYRSEVFGSFFIQDLCSILEDPKQFAIKDMALLLDEVDKKPKERAKEMEDDPNYKYYTQTPDRINRGFNKKFYLRSFHKLRSYYLDNLCNVKPLPWSTQFNWGVDEIYTPLVVTNADQSKESFPPEELFQRLEQRFPNGSGYRCLIEGNPGYGKSTLMLKLTSDWAKLAPCLSRFHLVLLVKLGEVGKKGDLEKRIRELYGDKIELTSTTALFKGELADKVLVLLDGYDEASEKTKDFVHKIMVKELWSQSHVVLTSRFGYVADDLKGNSNALCAKLEGFRKRDVAIAVGKFFIKAGHRTKHEFVETVLELTRWRYTFTHIHKATEEEEEEQEIGEEFSPSNESWSTEDDGGDSGEISEYRKPYCPALDVFKHIQVIKPLLPQETRLDKQQLEYFLWTLLYETPYKDLAKCPLLCFMFCCLVTEFPENRLPNSMTDLYFAIVNRNLYRASFRKAPAGKFHEKWDWQLLQSKVRKDQDEDLTKFGLVCLKYLQSNAPHVTLFDLTGDKETSDPNHPQVELLLETGVIVEGDSTPFNTVYHPVHRTMAEFLAAYYLSQLEDEHQVEGHFLELYVKDTSFQEIRQFGDELDKEKNRKKCVIQWGICFSYPINTPDCCDKIVEHEVMRNGFAVRTKESHAYFVTGDARVYFTFENLAATSAWDKLALVLQKCTERKKQLKVIAITSIGPIGAENSDSVAVAREKCVGILKSLIGSTACPQEMEIKMEGVEPSKEGEEMKDQGEEVLMALLTAIRDPPQYCVLGRLRLKNFRLKGDAVDSFITTILRSSIKKLELEYVSCTFETVQLKKIMMEYTTRADFRLEEISTDETQWILQDPETFDLDPASFPLKILFIRRGQFTPRLLEWLAASVFKLRNLFLYIIPPGNWPLETEVLRKLLPNNANTLQELALATDQVSFPKEDEEASTADLMDSTTHNDGAHNGNLRQSLLDIIPLCTQLQKFYIWCLRKLPETAETALSVDESLIGLQKKILQLPLLKELALPPYGNAFFHALADQAHKWPGNVVHNTGEMESWITLEEIKETAIKIWNLKDDGIDQMLNVFRERDVVCRFDKTEIHPIIWFPAKTEFASANV